MAGINPKIKKALLSTLKLANTNPYAKMLFEEVAGIVQPPFKTSKFTAVLMPEDFLLGVYDLSAHPTWRHMAETDFEKGETTLIKCLAPYIDCFIDIGAHVGFYTCLVGKLSRAAIFCFEPNQKNFKNLVKNIAINNIKKATALNVALGNVKKNSKLLGSDGRGSLRADTFKTIPDNFTKVQVATLDSFSKHLTKFHATLLKMDVEGGEWDVLTGAKKLFTSHPPAYMIVELVKYWSSGENPKFKATFDLLASYGYKAVDFENNKYVGGNYLFVHKSKLKNYEKITSHK